MNLRNTVPDYMVPFMWNIQRSEIHRNRGWADWGPWGRRGGRTCLMGMGFPCRGWKCLGTRESWWLHDIVNILNITEPFTLKWVILCHVNFTSIRCKEKKKTPASLVTEPAAHPCCRGRGASLCGPSSRDRHRNESLCTSRNGNQMKITSRVTMKQHR